MRSYERHSITIDQCSECRGVFLDSGELQHLIDAEGRYHSAPAQSGEGRHDRDEHSKHGHKKHKQGGFLSEVFDFG